MMVITADDFCNRVESDFESGDLVDAKEQSVGDEEGPRCHDDDTRKLLERLNPVPVHPSSLDRVTTELGDSSVGKDARQKGTSNSSDAMQSPGVERVVDKDPRASKVGPAVTANSGDRTNRHARSSPNKAASGCNSNETGNDAVDDELGGDLLVVQVADQRVGETAGAGREVGDHSRVERLEVECEG